MGTPGGRLNARSIPVITALPSSMETLFPLSFWIRASNKTAPRIPLKVSQTALGPKKYTEAANIGSIARTTFHIITLTETSDLMCGDEETISFSLNFPPQP